MIAVCSINIFLLVPLQSYCLLCIRALSHAGRYPLSSLAVESAIAP